MDISTGGPVQDFPYADELGETAKRREVFRLVYRPTFAQGSQSFAESDVH